MLQCILGTFLSKYMHREKTKSKTLLYTILILTLQVSLKYGGKQAYFHGDAHWMGLDPHMEWELSPTHWIHCTYLQQLQKNLHKYVHLYSYSNSCKYTYQTHVLGVCMGWAISLQRSSWKLNTFLTSIARWVRESIFRTNRCSRGEMWLNRQTDRHTDPIT